MSLERKPLGGFNIVCGSSFFVGFYLCSSLTYSDALGGPWGSSYVLLPPHSRKFWVVHDIRCSAPELDTVVTEMPV